MQASLGSSTSLGLVSRKLTPTTTGMIHSSGIKDSPFSSSKKESITSRI